MPKSKTNLRKKDSEIESKDELKETLIDDEEKEIDPDLISGDLEDEESEDLDVLDDDEVDPFRDKWEE